jgi:hypothetical protein
MAESDIKPPEQKPTPNQEAVDDLLWDIPFARPIWKFFVREGKAVRHGWVAVAVIVVIAVYFTRLWTKGDVDKNISDATNYFGGVALDLRGQLSDAKQDRDKYQLMLAPFQAAALKIYTNEPLNQRLDFLAKEMDGISKQAIIELRINDSTNLVITELPPGAVFTCSNSITLNDRKIRVGLLNESKYPAINSFVNFLGPFDPSNLTIVGWSLEPQSDAGINHWRYCADHSIPKNYTWLASTIEISTNIKSGYFVSRFDIGADNAEIKSYWIGFTIP